VALYYSTSVLGVDGTASWPYYRPMQSINLKEQAVSTAAETYFAEMKAANLRPLARERHDAERVAEAKYRTTIRKDA